MTVPGRQGIHVLYEKMIVLFPITMHLVITHKETNGVLDNIIKVMGVPFILVHLSVSMDVISMKILPLAMPVRYIWNQHLEILT